MLAMPRAPPLDTHSVSTPQKKKELKIQTQIRTASHHPSEALIQLKKYH